MSGSLFHWFHWFQWHCRGGTASNQPQLAEWSADSLPFYPRLYSNLDRGILQHVSPTVALGLLIYRPRLM